MTSRPPPSLPTLLARLQCYCEFDIAGPLIDGDADTASYVARLIMLKHLSAACIDMPQPIGFTTFADAYEAVFERQLDGRAVKRRKRA